MAFLTYATRSPLFGKTTVSSFAWSSNLRSRNRVTLSSTVCLFATNTTTAVDAPAIPSASPKKKKKSQTARDKRRALVGRAKAVDRGQWAKVYAPGGNDGRSFVASSGLPPSDKKVFTVLGIESSCDDTGAAVVRSDGVVLGEALASQSQIHEDFGGVVPGLAMKAHEENIDRVVDEALANAGMSSAKEVDAIGVTVGPGLEICLRVGCHKGRDLALEHNKPFVGVHHLEAHVLMARMSSSSGGEDDNEDPLDFPFLALLVSGGHCQILMCEGVGRYSIIGGTIDDSLGEAFDKVARLLGLPVGGGGGPAVERLAKEGDPKAVPLPVPMRKRKDCDFSYAGLKTAVRRQVRKMEEENSVRTDGAERELTHAQRADVAASFQNTAVKHVEDRLKRAMDERVPANVRELAVVGGVAANSELRERLRRLCDERNWRMRVPPPRLCTDQGAMSAWAAVERIAVGSTDEPREHDVYARYPFANKDRDKETD